LLEELKQRKFVPAAVALELLNDFIAAALGARKICLHKKVKMRMSKTNGEKKNPMTMYDSGYHGTIGGKSWLFTIGRWIGGDRFQSLLLAVPLPLYADVNAFSAADAISVHVW